ncbi:MAG TPA: polysaccharide biosynthesis tyrosine autokinase [Bacteroidales bacterium]|nr:polysaccharide biosynthesis tyrosine autokinase [Bacteroidales bacterium]
MPHNQNINIQEETDLKRIVRVFTKHYWQFIFFLFAAMACAFFINRYKTPVFKISSSLLIKENRNQTASTNVNDFLNSNMFGRNQNFQNELWVIKSYPIIEETVNNLGLVITYYTKGKFSYYEAYETIPFKISFLQDHSQPIGVKFNIDFDNDSLFTIHASGKKVSFYNFARKEATHFKAKWDFSGHYKIGDVIENDDLTFVVERSEFTNYAFDPKITYAFNFKPVSAQINSLKGKLSFNLVDRLATVIKITHKSELPTKGIDVVNELMSVYSQQNLQKKNHLATVTIQYIEKQLGAISDSLTQTEDHLQNFRASNQLLDISNQAAGLSASYLELQNQLAEMIAKKKYYDYIIELLKEDNFSNLMLPASIGISDPILNNMMSELVSAQAQRSNLIENNQERNPLVQKLTIQIETLKKTISDNVSTFSKSTSVSIDDMNKRVKRVENEISRLPATQRRLGSIERKYRLNEAIYNYMMEKHAEAKIAQASNLPDDIVIEPAKMEGEGPVSPNALINYLIAAIFGIAFPFSLIMFKNAINNKIESQEDIEKLTDSPLLGKIAHSRYKTNNVMHEFPRSNLAESFRALRTNLDFYIREHQKKIILVSSSLEHEGKSFVSLNLAMSYAQLGRKTILVDMDLRKSKNYFQESDMTREGLSSYMVDRAKLENIILQSPNDRLDYIQSGILPPNPVELLALEQTSKLIAKLKEKYDIIVLDSPPLAQVTDAYLLMNLADLKIIVTRQGYTPKNVFSLVMKDLNQKNVEKSCIVLNDNRIFGEQYGYGYGYYNKESQRQMRKFKQAHHFSKRR